MTTIYLNVRKGIAYADSQGTVIDSLYFLNKRMKEKIVGYTDNQKLFSSNNSIVAFVGDSDISKTLYYRFVMGVNPAAFPIKYKGTGTILILRKGYVISMSVKNSKIKKQVYFADYVGSGTGAWGPIVRNSLNIFWKLSQEDIVKCLKLNSLFDIYSNDKITIMKVGNCRN